MDLKILLTVFTTVFIAELGDKTQLATLLFAAEKDVSKLTVFLGSSLALIAASGIGVFAGAQLSQYISGKTLNDMSPKSRSSALPRRTPKRDPKSRNNLASSPKPF